MIISVLSIVMASLLSLVATISRLKLLRCKEFQPFLEYAYCAIGMLLYLVLLMVMYVLCLYNFFFNTIGVTISVMCGTLLYNLLVAFLLTITIASRLQAMMVITSFSSPLTFVAFTIIYLPICCYVPVRYVLYVPYVIHVTLTLVLVALEAVYFVINRDPAKRIRYKIRSVAHMQSNSSCAENKYFAQFPPRVDCTVDPLQRGRRGAFLTGVVKHIAGTPLWEYPYPTVLPLSRPSPVYLVIATLICAVKVLKVFIGCALTRGKLVPFTEALLTPHTTAGGQLARVSAVYENSPLNVFLGMIGIDGVILTICTYVVIASTARTTLTPTVVLQSYSLFRQFVVWLCYNKHESALLFLTECFFFRQTRSHNVAAANLLFTKWRSRLVAGRVPCSQQALGVLSQRLAEANKLSVGITAQYPITFGVESQRSMVILSPDVSNLFMMHKQLHLQFNEAQRIDPAMLSRSLNRAYTEPAGPITRSSLVDVTEIFSAVEFEVSLYLLQLVRRFIAQIDQTYLLATATLSRNNCATNISRIFLDLPLGPSSAGNYATRVLSRLDDLERGAALQDSICFGGGGGGSSGGGCGGNGSGRGSGNCSGNCGGSGGSGGSAGDALDSASQRRPSGSGTDPQGSMAGDLSALSVASQQTVSFDDVPDSGRSRSLTRNESLLLHAYAQTIQANADVLASGVFPFAICPNLFSCALCLETGSWITSVCEQFILESAGPMNAPVSQESLLQPCARSTLTALYRSGLLLTRRCDTPLALDILLALGSGSEMTSPRPGPGHAPEEGGTPRSYASCRSPPTSMTASMTARLKDGGHAILRLGSRRRPAGRSDRSAASTPLAASPQKPEERDDIFQILQYLTMSLDMDPLLREEIDAALCDALESVLRDRRQPRGGAPPVADVVLTQLYNEPQFFAPLPREGAEPRTALADTGDAAATLKLLAEPKLSLRDADAGSDSESSSTYSLTSVTNSMPEGHPGRSMLRNIEQLYSISMDMTQNLNSIFSDVYPSFIRVPDATLWGNRGAGIADGADAGRSEKRLTIQQEIIKRTLDLTLTKLLQGPDVAAGSPLASDPSGTMDDAAIVSSECRQNSLEESDACDLSAYLRGTVFSANFDVRQVESITRGHCLMTMVYVAINLLGLPRHFDLSNSVLIAVLHEIEAGYTSTAYHNRLHVADVVQVCFLFVFRIAAGLHGIALASEHVTTGSMFALAQRILYTAPFSGDSDAVRAKKTLLRPIDAFSLILAACCHDFGHTGIDNPFCINTGNILARIYNDEAPLENAHAALSWSLFQEHPSFFARFTPSMYREFRLTFLELILATDMSCHFAFLGKMKAIDRQTVNLMLRSSNQQEYSLLRWYLLKSIIKFADLSNPLRNQKVSKFLAVSLMNEFWTLGELMVECGLTPDKFKVRPDNSTKRQHIAECQAGFIAFIPRPFWNELRRIIRLICSDEPFEDFEDNLKANMEHWQMIKSGGAEVNI